MLCTKLKCIPKLLLVLNLASQTTSGFQCCLTNLTKIVSENPTNHCNFKTFNQLPIITNQEVFLRLHFKQNILQQTSKFTSLIIYFSLKFIPHSSHLNSDFVMFQPQVCLNKFLGTNVESHSPQMVLLLIIFIGRSNISSTFVFL